MKKFLLYLLILVILVMSACTKSEQSTWDRVSDNKRIVVGISADYKPFEFYNEKGEIVGIDLDILKSITGKLGLELEIVNDNFDSLIPGLISKKYDIVMSALTIKEDRKEEVNFSESYFDDSQVIVVKVDNEEIKRVEDLRDKVVGVQFGTVGALEVSKFKNLKKVEKFNFISEAFEALENGRIDALVNDLPSSKMYAEDNFKIKIVEEPLKVQKYGIAFRKEDLELLDKFNQTLNDIKEEGIYDEIYSKWYE